MSQGKHIRDPLYGFVDLTDDEVRLIDTEAYQRLRRIKQLSHAYVVYPTAVHSRFEHTLGATHVAGRMCDALEITGEDRINVRLAVLLHDIGHGPMSHLFERVLERINPGVPDVHEFISRAIISTNPEIDKVLGDRKEAVIDILDGGRNGSDPNLPLLSDIAAGKLDADKLDYLRRDSFHAGVAYGHFDLERILRTLMATAGRKRHIVVAEKGINAIENYRLARYLMHAQVYEHHARLAADRMFLRALDSAIRDEGLIDENLLRVRTKGYDVNAEFLSHYMGLDDDSIYHTIVAKCKNGKAAGILRDIRHRRLWKRVCQFRLTRINALIRRELFKDQGHLDEMVANIATRLSLDKNDIVAHLSDITIGLYGSGDILFVDGCGQPYDVKESSPIGAESSVQTYYVFSPADPMTRKKIAAEIACELQIDVDDIAVPSRQVP